MLEPAEEFPAGADSIFTSCAGFVAALATGATLTKGTAVYINGATGQTPTVAKAQANAESTSAQTQGLITADIANNGFGYVTAFGLVTNIDTSAYADGTQLYLSGTVAGGLTSTKPSAPNVKVQMAAVINGGSSGGGTILIRINAGSVLGGTDSNVQFGTLATGDLIRYNGTYWTNVATIGNSNLTNSSITINTTIRNNSYEYRTNIK